MNYLQKRFASLLPRRHPSELLKPDKEENINDLINQYHQAQSDEEKAHALDKIYAKFPRTLFLASICYPEDDPTKAVYDRVLHSSPGAKHLYEENQPVVMNGNPGYKLARKDNGKRSLVPQLPRKG